MPVETLRPYWSSFIESDTVNREISDPLGFRSAANQIARILVPDLTQRTVTARGFSLLLLGLSQSSKRSDHSPDERFLRFERLIVLARTKQDKKGSMLAGKEAAQRILDGSVDGSYTLERSLLTRQLASGIWGQYRVASEKLGLIVSRGGRTPARSQLTENGRAWIKGLSLSEISENRNITRAVTNGSADDELLEVISKTAIGSSDKGQDNECRLLKNAIEITQKTDGPLAKLRKEFEQLNPKSLTPNRLNGQNLTNKQAAALDSANALVDLMKAIELPFREGMVYGKETELGQIKGADWTSLQKSLNGTAASDMKRLCDISEKGFVAVLEHHKKISKGRGNQPWIFGELDNKYKTYDDPDFTLSAVLSLFEEGVDPQ